MAIIDVYHLLAEEADMTSDIDSDAMDWAEDPVIKGGHPRPLWFEIHITDAPSGTGNIVCHVQGADDDGTGSAGAFVDLLSLPAIDPDDLSVGDVIYLPFPMTGFDSSADWKPDGPPRYLRVHIDETDVASGECTIVFRGG